MSRIALRFIRATVCPAEGIEKYLASGMIKGIGPIYAKKMVRAFSEAVFDVIEQKRGSQTGRRWSKLREWLTRCPS